MSEAQFIDAIRQYAAMARRKHISYAAQVAHIREIYLNAALDGVDEPQDRVHAITRADRMISNEYEPWDKEYSVPASG